MTANLQSLIRLGGIFHLGILIASASVPGALQWKTELAKLGKLSRQLVWVHGAFIVLVIIGFGVLSLCQAPAMASGSPLGRSLCGFIALFWLARLAVQFAVFDAKPFLGGQSVFLAAGYHGLTVVFTYLAFVYATAAIL